MEPGLHTHVHTGNPLIHVSPHPCEHTPSHPYTRKAEKGKKKNLVNSNRMMLTVNRESESPGFWSDSRDSTEAL